MFRDSRINVKTSSLLPANPHAQLHVPHAHPSHLLQGSSPLSRLLDRAFVVRARCMLWAMHCIAVAALSAMEMRAISVAKKLKQQQQQQEQQQEHDSLQASSHDTLSQPQPSSSSPTTLSRSLNVSFSPI